MEERPGPQFKRQVEDLVKQIPVGRVMTYGQIATLCGKPRAARLVGGIAHFGNPVLPWQRVVNRFGGLASGYPGGRRGQKLHLEADGIPVADNMTVDVSKYIWWPSLKQAPVIVIVGPTASGKSSLALKIADHFNGEIICADSLTLRRELRIGTAKPSINDQAMIKHHLLDVISPCEQFSAADFKVLAEAAITDIKKRGKLPILVGGSGLYIDSLLYDYSFRGRADKKQRTQLNQLSSEALIKKVDDLGLDLNDLEVRNRHRLIRYIETAGQTPKQGGLRPDAFIIGLQLTSSELKTLIERRTRRMIQAGLEAEVRQLASRHGWDCPALKAVGYSEWQDYLEGQKSLAEVVTNINQSTRQLAKRQATWFKRNKSIHWLSTPVNWNIVVDVLTTILAS